MTVSRRGFVDWIHAVDAYILHIRVGREYNHRLHPGHFGHFSMRAHRYEESFVMQG